MGGIHIYIYIYMLQNLQCLPFCRLTWRHNHFSDTHAGSFTKGILVNAERAEQGLQMLKLNIPHTPTKEKRNLEGKTILGTEKMESWEIVQETEEEEKLETKKGKKEKKLQKLRWKPRPSMQTLSCKTVVRNFAGISA